MHRSLPAVLLVATLATGCAHVTTSEQDATIWLDGRPIGRGGLVWALGPPHTARVVVVARDGRRAHALVHREFGWNAFQAGVYTLGICFVFCWAYPDTHVVLPAPRPRAETWDDDGWDARWMAPPAAAAAAAADAAPSPSPSPSPTPTPTPSSTPTPTPTSTSTSTPPTPTSRR